MGLSKRAALPGYRQKVTWFHCPVGPSRWEARSGPGGRWGNEQWGVNTGLGARKDSWMEWEFQSLEPGKALTLDLAEESFRETTVDTCCFACSGSVPGPKRDISSLFKETAPSPLASYETGYNMINPKLWLSPQPALGPGSEFQLTYLLAMLADPRWVRVLVIGITLKWGRPTIHKHSAHRRLIDPLDWGPWSMWRLQYCSPPLRQSLCGIWDNDEDIK